MKLISTDGTPIAFESIGQGPPLILVDGALCSRSFGPMPKLAALLAPHFTVFTYDRRGRGDSGDRPPYAVAREIQDLAALVKVAGRAPFVFGMSSGAALALEATAHGVDIGKLALYEPPFIVVDPEDRRPPADAAVQLKYLIAQDRRGDAVKYYMTEIAGASSLFVGIMPFMPAWPKMQAAAHTLFYDVAIMRDYRPPVSRLEECAVPSLVIGGERSGAAPRKAVHAVARALPNARRLMLEEQNHNVSMKVLAPVLKDFFTARVRRPRTIQEGVMV